MADEIELVSDGDGLLLLGPQAAVDRFLVDAGIGDAGASSRDSRLWTTISAVAGLMQIHGHFAENSGRWIKLTEQSAKAVQAAGGLMATKTPGISHAMIGQPGNIESWLQVAQAPSALLAGPMMLPTIATVMAQQAMQRQMDEIQDYLAVIDEKVDDILRAQQDGVLADMIGVDLVVDEAMTIRGEVGRVSDVTWSKVQSTSLVIARTQAYAVRQLDALADKLDAKADMGEVAKVAKAIEPRAREWLAVMARCFQLQDALAVLELDRVLGAAPDELDRHRVGLRIARQQRIDAIGGATQRLLERMDETVRSANRKVLMNPFDAPAAVRTSNQVAARVLEARARLGIESAHEVTDAKRWGQAAFEVRDRVLAVSTATLDRAADPFRKIDVDGDGVPDRSRAAVAAEEAGVALKDAAAGVSGAFGTLFRRGASTEDAPREAEADTR